MPFNIIDSINSRLSEISHHEPIITYINRNREPSQYTSSAVVKKINDLSHRIASFGIQQGDVVLQIPTHDPETPLLFLALIRVGAIPCLLPYMRSGFNRSYLDAAAETFSSLNAKFLVSASKVEQIALKHDDRFPELLSFLDGPTQTQTPSATRTRRNAPNEIAYLQLTSGTTGRSKAIATTHEALSNQLESSCKRIDVSQNDAFVGWLPLNHDMGLISQIFMPLFSGARTIIIAPNHWISDPLCLLKAVEANRGTITYMPNFGLYYLRRRLNDDHVRTIDLSSWRIVFNGAEMVRPATIAAFNDLISLGGVDRNIVAPGYGLGENVLAVSFDLPSEVVRSVSILSRINQTAGEIILVPSESENAISVVSCGRPINGTEVWIKRNGEISQKELVAGEIVVTGNSLSPCYFGNEGVPIASDSGFDTGDLGFLYQGEVYIIGRSKELAVIAGRNINPTVVAALAENCIGTLQRRSCAFAVSSDLSATEALVVICETTRSLSPDESHELSGKIRGAVARALEVGVQEVLFKSNNWLPRTTSGKVNIGEARRKYLKELSERSPNAKSHDHPASLRDLVSVKKYISSIATRILGFVPVVYDEDLFDQGLDSLGLAELLTEIDLQYGLRVPDSFFVKPSIDALAEYLVTSQLSKSPDYKDAPANSPEILAMPYHARGNSPRLRHYMRYGPRGALKNIGYGQGTFIQRQLMRIPKVRDTFSSELSLVDEWHTMLRPSQDLDSCRKQSLIANTWMDWRASTLSSDRSYRTWTDFRLPDDFKEGRSLDRGVVVVVPHVSKLHWPLYRFVWQCLSKRLAVIRDDTDASYLSDRSGLEGLSSRARQTWEASRVLREGGALIIAGDGQSGNVCLDIPYGSKSASFQCGAAELALKTGAYFLPVFPKIQGDGKILFQFVEPINSNAELLSDQVRDVTARYAAMHEKHFVDHFCQFKWEFLRNFRSRLR